MPPQQPKRNGLLQRLWNAVQPPRKKEEGSIQGSQYPTQFGSGRNRQYMLEIPENPVRPVNGDLALSRELVEMVTWSYEARHSTAIAARDCFQRVDGSTSSWFVSSLIDDDTPTHPDVLAIAKDLQNRRYGNKLIIGGNALERGIRDAIRYGDGFYEIAIEKSGLGNEYGISKGVYLPSLSIFRDEDEAADTKGFWQRVRIHPSSEDRWISPLKMLNFCYEENQLYGTSMLFQSLEPYRKLKKVSIDIEEASRALGCSPWLHIMPPEATGNTNFLTAYIQDLEAMRMHSLMTDLYLMPGAEVKKASTDSGVLQPLIDNFLLQRTLCIPPVFPIWMFPYSALKGSEQKDLSAAPGLAYSRLISYLRSIIGEQVHYSISIELILKRGWDWYQENGRFEVAWEPFPVDALSAMITTQDELDQQEEKKSGSANEKDDVQRLLLDVNSLISTPDLDVTDQPELASLARRTDALLQKYPEYGKLHQTKAKLRQLMRETSLV